MSEIEAILFDFGGTLDDDGRDWFARLYSHVVRRLGRADREAFYRYADKAAHHAMTLADTAQLDMDGMVARLCEHIHEQWRGENGDGDLGWAPAEVITDFMAEARSVLERNRKVMQQLAQRFRLGVISNNWGNTAGWCAQFDLEEYLDTMVDSAVVGASKPERAIFQAALDELGLPARACVYVGDRYGCDVLGARAAGLQAVWMGTGDGETTVDETQFLARIAQLPDLLDLDWVKEK